mgnify:CR=1 FL=1|tara:strand:+ start:19327 stop:19716 length:390 start_codon:yes stop_codon:yes gene_type:complete
MAKKQITQELITAESINYKDVLLVKRRLNAGTDTEILNEQIYIDLIDGDDGIKYLRNLHKSPTGKIRKNNPFGNRETEILENFTHFALVGFMNQGNRYHDYYTPIWAVNSADGDTFEYIQEAGTIKIIS